MPADRPADRQHDATDNGPDRAPVVRVRDLDKRFARGDTAVAAIDGVSFDVHPGEMVVLVGPSGCGKTTLLRAIAGLERPDAGTIELHGTPCFSSAQGIDVPVERRRVSMVFQNYALWPHLTAFQNVVYPLRSQRKGRPTRSQAAERVHEVLELVGIPDLADQYPSAMSGGQRQRVALARALVAGTDLVLFDEPLSNVDAKVRTHLRLELLAMQRDLGFSALFVTHDQAEAMELADRIAVMGAGRIEQFGTPSEVYHEPATRYVADFIGSMNEVTGHVASITDGPDDDRAGGTDGDVVTVETELGTVHGHAGADLAVGDAVSAIWRPERTLLADDSALAQDTGRVDDGHHGVEGAVNDWRGSVDAALFLGSHTEHVVVVDGHRFLVWSPDVMRHDDDVEVRLTVDPRHVRVLPSDPSSASDGLADQ